VFDTNIDMKHRPERRINLLDIMIVVAAAAVGFWLSQIYMRDSRSAPGWERWLGASYLVLLAVTLGLLVPRLLPPRPSIRRLARQPGFLAEIAVLSFVILKSIAWGIDRLAQRGGPGSFGFDLWLHNFLISISGPFYVGPAVATAWIIGLLQGMRWARPDWLESLGRLVGLLWLVYWVVLLGRGFF
jgi:hypothetical protein